MYIVAKHYIMSIVSKYDANAEVIGQVILSFVNAVPGYTDTMWTILNKYGLKDIQPEQWYNCYMWLSGMAEIGENYGPNTLFAIGKAIPEYAILPPNIKTVRDILEMMNVGYNLNHRNGYVGSYELISFDEQQRKAMMVCETPYPSHCDRGIITTMVRKFKPEHSVVQVVLDETKPNRLKGADSCTFLISW